MKVLNKSKDRIPPDAVYCGRPGKWGNPFVIPQDGDRETVVRKHREWLLRNASLMRDIGQLTGRSLVCWCAPAACHCDTLMEIANRGGWLP